jgi:citrate synthase (EC 2.3.3.1)
MDAPLACAQSCFAAIDALPLTAHPMTMFVTGVMALQTESHFAKAYARGISKKITGSTYLMMPWTCWLAYRA